MPPSPLALWRGRAVQPIPDKRYALFERSEFARRRGWRTAQGPEELAPAEAGGHATANVVLATFAETKVARPPGRNRAFIKQCKTWEIPIVFRRLYLP